MRMVPIKEIAPPKGAECQFNSDDVVWQLTLDQIESNSGRIVDKVMDSVASAGSSTYAFDNGNVLYSKLRPYLNKVICPNESGIATTELVPLRPIPGDLDRKYLCYYLRSPEFVHWVSHQVSGAKMPRVNMKVFWKHEIPVPHIDEQARIVAILDKAESARWKRSEAIRLADDLLKSVFLDMFGDPVVNSKEWNTDVFANVGTLDRGRSRHRPRNAPELLGGPYPLVQTGDIANAGGYIRDYAQTYSEVGLAQSKMWPVGTLCITIAANIAKTAILTIEACFPDSVVGFTPNGRVRTEYVQYWLSFLQKILEENAPESAQKNINLEILRGLEIPLPPIELQNAFVTLVQKTEATKDAMRKASSNGASLFESLLQRAFQGSL